MIELFNEHPIYFLMAFIGTFLFTAKLILLFIAGDGDLDTDTDVDIDLDVDGDVHGSSDTSFALISLQSILAFLMGTGWLGLAATTEWKLNNWQAALAASGFGLVMMLMSAFLSSKLKSLNTRKKAVNYRELIGTQAQVYLKIPENSSGTGQIQLIYQGRQQILTAICEEQEEISSFTKVEIIDADETGNIVVKTIKQEK